MSYEEIQGEIMTMSDNVEPGLSGTSTDWEGAQEQDYIHVHWSWPGGITGIDWYYLSGQLLQIENIAKDPTLEDNEKRTQINEIVFTSVTALINSYSFDDMHQYYDEKNPSCITVG